MPDIKQASWKHHEKQLAIYRDLGVLSNNLVEVFKVVGEPSIALWDGAGGDGPGGTEDLVEKAQTLGARDRVIYTKELFGL
jgi:hypothetical protein